VPPASDILPAESADARAGARVVDCATDPAPADPRPRRRWYQHLFRALLALILAAAMAGGSLYLFTRHNDFPTHYHPDEWSKARQLLDPGGDRNFNHPLLMLRAAGWWFDHTQWPTNERDVVLQGRNVSAALAAGAVLLLSLAAYATGGFTGLCVAGTTMALCPPLLVYAQYLKEDATLAFGISAAVFGAALVVASRRWYARLPAAAIVGAGVALAASGKYAGAVAAAPAALAILLAPPTRWFWWPLCVVWLMVAAAAAVPLAVWINEPAFADPWQLKLRPDIQEHLGGELEHATVTHNGVGLVTPNTFLARTTAGEIMPHLWALLALAAVAWVWKPQWRVWRMVSAWGVVALLFVAAFAAALAYNAIPFRRYALPLTVLSYFAIACWLAAGINRWTFARRDWKRGKWIGLSATAAAVLAVGMPQLARCLNFNEQIAHDSRQKVREWVALNLPPGTRILAESYTGFDGDGDRRRFPDQARLQQDIETRFLAGHSGPLNTVIFRGYQYVIVSEPAYERFLLPDSRGTEGEELAFAVAKQFYLDLFEKGELVWSSEPDPPTNAYINPAIRVYRLPETITPATNRPPPPRDGRRRGR
jgi:hypothetical protein